MYKKKLWKPIIAGTLALAMALTPAVGGRSVSAAEPEEMTTEAGNEEITTEEEAEATTEEASEETNDASTEATAESTDSTDSEEVNTAGDIPLTAAYFPDANFRKYVSDKIDTDKNGVLSQAERAACVEIDIAGSSDKIGEYKDLTGIEYFTELKTLKCQYNQLTNLDISRNIKLTYLDCGDNLFTSFDVSKNTQLTCLRCDHIRSKFDTRITRLDVSNNTKLTYLTCWGNSLTTLDVSKNTQLTDLNCNSNQIKNLDVSNNTKLTDLCCHSNDLTSLNVSKNTLLEKLYCYNNDLKSLDVSKNTQLRLLWCSESQLTSLDVSKNVKLNSLSCGYNYLTSLDVSKNTLLYELYCSNNRLAYLNLTSNTKLQFFSPDKNEYPVVLNSKRQVDLKTIPGFQVSKVSSLNGGTISGTILTFKSGVNKVTYTYDCGNGHTAKFTISNDLTKAFCTRLYTLCLGRAADESGVNYWTQQLLNKKQTGASIGYNFVFSDEYKKKNTSDEAYVKMLYKVFMDREADKGGLNYWLDLLNQGMSREYVYKGFAESKEFTNICASYGIERGTVKLTQARDQNVNLTKFVNRIYVKAMNRKGDASGLNHWCNQILTKKMTPVQVAESFIYSKEFTDKNLSNTEYIKVLYRTFMGREADSAGLNYWLGRLNKGDSRKTVLKAFAGCQEFKNIVKSFGL